MKSVTLPRFAYMFLRRPYHSRAIAAWAILRTAGKGRPVTISSGQALLCRLFGVTEKAVRDLRRHPKAGTFWEERNGVFHLQTPAQLWGLVEKESAISGQQFMRIPLSAFRRLVIMKAWIAQSALSRGPRPCSRAYSAKMIGCGERAVTEYRRLLAAAGFLEAYAQYEDCGKLLTAGTLAQVRVPRGREFVAKGRIRKRLPDIVLLRDGAGKMIDILVNEELAGKGRKRYHRGERFVSKAPAPESLVLVSKNIWTNVLSADRGDSISLNDLSISPKPSPSGKRSLPISHTHPRSSGARQEALELSSAH